MVGDAEDADLVSGLIAEHGINAIMHFGAIHCGSSRSHSLSPIIQTTRSIRLLRSMRLSADVPPSPYGTSKLEMMLRDAASTGGLSYAVLHYFNVARRRSLLRTEPRI
jgi:UDP-glucose 4-epimerase